MQFHTPLTVEAPDRCINPCSATTLAASEIVIFKANTIKAVG